MLKALLKTPLDLGNWKEGVTGLVTETAGEMLDLGKKGEGMTVEAAQETVKNTADNLKKLLPFRK